jgi:hypothetical protein
MGEYYIWEHIIYGSILYGRILSINRSRGFYHAVGIQFTSIKALTKRKEQMDHIISDLVRGYSNWIYQVRRSNWSVFYINIMFHQLNTRQHNQIIQLMGTAIHKHFYPTLCNCLFRHPGRRSQEQFLPRCVLFFDLPTWKRNKNTSSSNAWTGINRGLHLNGFILVNPKSRLKEDFVTHITRMQHLYVDHLVNGQPIYDHGGIARVHVEPVEGCHSVITDYSMKTIKAGNVDYDTTIILPRPASELKSPASVLDAKSSAVKDIQASTNLSDDAAATFYDSQRR